MSHTRRMSVLAATVATAGILGVTGVAYAGDYDGDGGHGGWDHGGWDHGRCGHDRGLVGNLVHGLLGGGC